MYVYDRSGHYLGRAGGRVRDVRTGELQRMGPPRPTPTAGTKCRCLKSAAQAVAAFVAHVIHRV